MNKPKIIRKGRQLVIYFPNGIAYHLEGEYKGYWVENYILDDPKYPEDVYHDVTEVYLQRQGIIGQAVLYKQD